MLASRILRAPVLGPAYLRYIFHVTDGSVGERDVPAHVRKNLQETFGDTMDERELSDIAVRHLRFMKRKDLHRILGSSLTGTRSWWRVDGQDRLDKALRRGKGALLVGAHFGHSKAIAATLRACGYVARLVMHAPLSAQSARDAEGAIIAGIDVRPIVEALARNECLVTTGDGMRASEFASVQFLGRQYPMPTGLMKLAQITGASVLPTFAVEVSCKLPLAVEIEDEIRIDAGVEPATGVQRFAEILEQRIGGAPHLWYRWSLPDLFVNSMEWSRSAERWTRSFNEWCQERNRRSRGWPELQ